MGPYLCSVLWDSFLTEDIMAIVLCKNDIVHWMKDTCDAKIMHQEEKNAAGYKL